MARKRATLRDWLFGSEAKRLLLNALMADRARLWTKRALADAAHVGRHGGVDEHVAALRQLGLIDADDGRWRLVESHPLVNPIERLLAALESVPESDLERD